jgi:hypothetical protein
MKKVITILLVLLFTVNEFSFITVYLPLRNLANYMQKARVESCYDPNDFAVIVVKESEYLNESSPARFFENSEFLFNGELYDVVNTVTKDGNVYIYCIKDETENLLDKSFKLHFDNHQNRKFSLNFFNVTIAKKLIAFVFEDYINCSIPKIDNVVVYYINPDLKPFIDKHTPPPKFS